MGKDVLEYDKMIVAAYRGVMRDALKIAAERGLPGNHHFYLTFRTNYPGVVLPDFLHQQYPSEMTIVLQFQYFGLEVEADRFGVTLSFGGRHERLTIPFAAISTFADPSVNFALQFPVVEPETSTLAPVALADVKSAEAKTEEAEQAASEPDVKPAEEKRGEVVALDAFRKKP